MQLTVQIELMMVFNPGMLQNILFLIQPLHKSLIAHELVIDKHHLYNFAKFSGSDRLNRKSARQICQSSRLTINIVPLPIVRKTAQRILPTSKTPRTCSSKGSTGCSGTSTSMR